MKQEGAFSLLASYGFCALGLFGPKWYDLYRNDYNFFLGIFDQTNGLFVFDWGKYKETTDIEYRLMIKEGKGSYLRVLPLFEKHSAEMFKLYQANHPAVIAKMDIEKLRQHIINSNELTSIILRDTLFSESFDEDMAKVYYLQAGGQEEYFQEFFAMTSALTFDSFKFRRDKIILNDAKQKKIDYYKLQYIYTDHFAGKLLIEVEKMVNNLNFNILLEEIKINDQQVENNKERREKYIQALPDSLKALAHFMEVTMRIRDERQDCFAQGMTIAYNCAYEYFKRLGFNPKDCIYSFYTDYLNNILENPEYSQLIENRKKGCAVIAEAGQPVKYTWEFKEYQQVTPGIFRYC